MPHRTHAGAGTELDHCIQECTDCHRVCLETVRYCLEQGGEHAVPGHIGLLLDCAEICQTSANFMIRGSELHNRVCGLCAEVCDRCADSCESMGNDARMKTCAEACRSCAESCREMAS